MTCSRRRTVRWRTSRSRARCSPRSTRTRRRRPRCSWRSTPHPTAGWWASRPRRRSGCGAYPQTVTDLSVAGEHVRVVTVPARFEGQVIAWVAAGRSLEAEDRLLHQVRLLLLVGGAIAVVASLFAGWWLAGRAVRPVERAYRAQAGFAADASHELRTPLAFIRSGVEVLSERDPDLGNEVLADVDYLTGLTQRLLMMARAESGTVSLERTPIDVGPICRSAARRSEVAHADRLTISGPDDLTAVGDRVGLEAALDAVLENVHEHGGGTAELTLGRRRRRRFGLGGGSRPGSARRRRRAGVRAVLPRRSVAGEGYGGRRARAVAGSRAHPRPGRPDLARGHARRRHHRARRPPPGAPVAAGSRISRWRNDSRTASSAAMSVSARGRRRRARRSGGP